MRHNITKRDLFFLGLFIGLVVVGGIFTFFQPAPNIIMDDKFKECIDEGGEYSLVNYRWYDDDNDYRAICRIPKKELWEINVEIDN